MMIRCVGLEQFTAYRRQTMDLYKMFQDITEVIHIYLKFCTEMPNSLWNFAWDAKFSRELCMGMPMPNSLFGGGYQKH